MDNKSSRKDNLKSALETPYKKIRIRELNQSINCKNRNRNNSSSSQSTKNQTREILKKLKHQLFKSLHSPIRLKPISWGQSIYWIRYTFRTDCYHYKPKQRPLSFQRLLSNCRPKLQAPIFVVGAPRSGTTFLGSCLAELPELSYHFEPVLTKAAARYVYEKQWTFKQASRFYRTVFSWLMRLHLDGDLRFAEKTPQDCFVIPFLSYAFPDAKFIHIIRDGRDAALSLAHKPWHRNDSSHSTVRDPDGYLCGPWARFWVESKRIEEFENTDDFHRCIWLWQEHVLSVMKAASELKPGSYYELRYEEFITDPSNQTEKLLDFIGIESLQSRNIMKKSVINEVKADSMGRWMKELSSTQHQKGLQEAGSLLQELGYWKSERGT